MISVAYEPLVIPARHVFRLDEIAVAIACTNAVSLRKALSAQKPWKRKLLDVVIETLGEFTGPDLVADTVNAVRHQYLTRDNS